MLWIQEYEKLFFADLQNDEMVEKGILLKNKYLPDTLFKYRSISENTINALEKNILIASSLSYLNDPNEGILHADYKSIWRYIYNEMVLTINSIFNISINIDAFKVENKEEIYKTIIESKALYGRYLGLFQKMWDELELKLEEQVKSIEKGLLKISETEYRICSFSEVYDSNVMWSHYADQHNGFCIAYNTVELNNEVKNMILPVRYRDEMIKVGDLIIDLDKDISSTFLLNPLTVKSVEWCYEKEWRYIVLTNGNEKKQEIQLPKPKEIIFGAKVDGMKKKRLVELAKKMLIPCSQMCQNSGEYKFEKKQIL